MFGNALSYLSRIKATIIIFTVLVIFNIVDIYSDLLEGSSVTHVLEETVMVLIFISIILYLVKKLTDNIKRMELLKVELNNINQLHAKQTIEMQRARKGYSEIIQQQFKEWQLSKSEVEIGFLLLKGLSLKEIASIREVKEKSTRQQASNIYAKAGFTGRHEFAGWFFEEF